MIKTFEITNNGSPVDPKGMAEITNKAVRNIKDYLSAGIFKSSTGRLRDSILGYAMGNVVHIKSDVEYADDQNDGVSSHIMWYLLGKTVPVNTRMGVVYRKATISSFIRGKWRHPGYPGKKFVEAGMAMVKNEYPGVTIREV